MELDNRINSGCSPFTRFDSEKAKEFIGEICFFANNPEDFADLSGKGITYDYLIGVGDCKYLFETKDNNYMFCLPYRYTSGIVLDDNKMREFALEEFLEKYPLGSQIRYRLKNNQECDCTGLFVNYSVSDECVTIGTLRYSLSKWFMDYDLFDGGKWQAFGVPFKNENR